MSHASRPSEASAGHAAPQPLRARSLDRRRLTLALVGVPAVAAQLAPLLVAGPWAALGTSWPEVNLALGIALGALGTLACVFAIERHVVAIGRSDRWALGALLGPLGLARAWTLEPGPSPSPAETSPTKAVPARRPNETRETSEMGQTPGARAEPPRVSRSRAAHLDRMVGVVLSAVLAVAFVWAAVRWLEGPPARQAPDAATVRSNERLAFERLARIAEAQKRYLERDWDGDGARSYAEFTVHLWQSVDPEGRPVAVGLIPRELGFAMVPELALDGYVFRSIHGRALDPSDGGARVPGAEPRREPIDPSAGWAVVAEPAERHRTGRYAMAVDESGQIWLSASAPVELQALPRDYRASGWTLVRSTDELGAMPAPTAPPKPAQQE